MVANKTYRFLPPHSHTTFLQYLIILKKQEGKNANIVVDISYPIITGGKLSHPRLSSLLVP